ncbi:RagB/SusD family nutrient uptake outer membrane protein [Parapedobacter sp. 10938]|uniref:RagB/SusD family nutrient uptake outer membrane protein n=1 Tax=Parapedobacter flavus TaxID=3110225 RepID=UPI002DBF6D05|nr:RagB/SusD family nutrient uptake outer membrane protein [Parapedobacter sp. 10938]MEC3878115.1 RagB/SusD family nutrient uptake outer membrane protein [Parapedobacter sp. 10938]
MKTVKKYIIGPFLLIFMLSCAKLDLVPLSEGSSENWYSDQTQIEMSLNDLYRTYVWHLEDGFKTDRWTDDWAQRLVVYEFPAGAITSEWEESEAMWTDTYKGISRANRVIEGLDNAAEALPEETINRLRAEAAFFRAYFYAQLITLYGDVPFFQNTMTIEEAFELGREDAEIVLNAVYADFDYAIEHLPIENISADIRRVSKGAAIAMKARVALWMSDWEIVKEETQKVMDLGVYSLHPDYETYFMSKKVEDETIFSLPRSKDLDEVWSSRNFMPRTAGGNAVAQPSWELLSIYPCTDGLLIDESPLFNPQKPFENRDPRLSATIVEFGSEFLGFIYDPDPRVEKVLNVNTGQLVENKDTKGYTQHASYNGLQLRKYADMNWIPWLADNPIILMRYADVLLMYAEAKIELGEIDETVHNAINQVRARAYHTTVGDVTNYPAVTTMDSDELRKTLRIERRIEFVWEGKRFWDLHRWREFEIPLNRPYYGLLPITEMRAKLIETDLWFWPITPEIDDKGYPDLDELYEQGYIAKLGERNFDPKQYKWPIPNKEILINDNLEPNDGY